MVTTLLYSYLLLFKEGLKVADNNRAAIFRLRVIDILFISQWIRFAVDTEARCSLKASGNASEWIVKIARNPMSVTWQNDKRDST